MLSSCHPRCRFRFPNPDFPLRVLRVSRSRRPAPTLWRARASVGEECLSAKHLSIEEVTKRLLRNIDTVSPYYTHNVRRSPTCRLPSRRSIRPRWSTNLRRCCRQCSEVELGLAPPSQYQYGCCMRARCCGGMKREIIGESQEEERKAGSGKRNEGRDERGTTRDSCICCRSSWCSAKRLHVEERFTDHCSFLLFLNSWRPSSAPLIPLSSSSIVPKLPNIHRQPNRAFTTLPPSPKSTSPLQPVTWVSWPTTFLPSKLFDRDCWKSSRPAVPRSTSVRRIETQADHAGAYNVFIASQSLPVSPPFTVTTH